MVHVKNMIFDRINHNQKPKNDETEAYFIGFLVDEFMKFYFECKADADSKGTPIDFHTEIYTL